MGHPVRRSRHHATPCDKCRSRNSLTLLDWQNPSRRGSAAHLHELAPAGHLECCVCQRRQEDAAAKLCQVSRQCCLQRADNHEAPNEIHLLWEENSFPETSSRMKKTREQTCKWVERNCWRPNATTPGSPPAAQGHLQVETGKTKRPQKQPGCCPPGTRRPRRAHARPWRLWQFQQRSPFRCARCRSQVLTIRRGSHAPSLEVADLPPQELPEGSVHPWDTYLRQHRFWGAG